jgi:hypothetical protein
VFGTGVRRFALAPAALDLILNEIVPTTIGTQHCIVSLYPNKRAAARRRDRCRRCRCRRCRRPRAPSAMASPPNLRSAPLPLLVALGTLLTGTILWCARPRLPRVVRCRHPARGGDRPPLPAQQRPRSCLAAPPPEEPPWPHDSDSLAAAPLSLSLRSVLEPRRLAAAPRRAPRNTPCSGLCHCPTDWAPSGGTPCRAASG